ncbi:AI-2E family transporter [Alkalibaculum sporogenes]|nr:AI-2E family transporter [Alkalibaculum sporogenes]
MNSKSFKQNILIVTYGIILFLALMNLSSVLNMLSKVFSIIKPFLYGFIIAYVLNIPYKWFREKLFYSIERKNAISPKSAKNLSLLTSYITVIILFTLMFWFIVPQLVSSVTQLVQNVPSYIHSLELLINQIDDFGPGALYEEQFANIWTDWLERLNSILADMIPHIANYIVSLTSGIYNWIIGLIVSIYILNAKEHLLRQMTRVLYAFGPQKHNQRIMELATRTNRMFIGFITGNVIDSVIVGILCFLGMSIFKMPYALLVSIIVGVFNIIPIVGPFIGAIPGVFIILIVDPFQALLFTIFILALQQFDGNIIKPRIFGDRVGLPSLWVLISILVGGGLLGIPGMIIGVPTFALIYSILRDEVNIRLEDDIDKKK